jgi:plastocyanin
MLPVAAQACHPVMAGEPNHGCGGMGTTAAVASVTVGDDFFEPDTVQINPGDTVNWQWQNAGAHTVTTYPNQTERFDSGTRSGNASFSHVFNRRGRFTYFCELHPLSMRSAVEVGPPPFPDTILPRITRLSARGARLFFRLSEDATVRVTVKRGGRVVKRVKRSLRKGRRSVAIRGLARGRYSAALVPTDKAGNRGRAARTTLRIS